MNSLLRLARQYPAAVAAVLLIVVGAFGAGVYFGASGKTASSSTFFDGTTPPDQVNFGPLWKAWEVLEEKYVSSTSTKQVTAEDKLWGTIQGLAGSYGDPYTVFMPPEDRKVFEADISGSFGGVGMEIGKRNDVLTVIAPLKGTPAAAAGILTGDKVLEINGDSTDKLSVDEAIRKIRGEVGTTVKLTIQREGSTELKPVSIVRAVISVPPLATELRADGIFVIELYSFSATSPGAFREALREFSVSGTDKLILDLRGNPGGFLEAAVDIASWFLPAGKVIVTEHFGGDKDDRIYRSKGYNVFTDNLKMAILINEGSASASEILAGALQQHTKEKLIGENSYGKGSVQELIPITSDTSLKVTVAQWLTPNGSSISDGGLKPDIEVKLTAEDLEKGKDPQLEKAVQLLKS